MNDFWIGDYVLVKSKNLFGKYHKDGQGDTCLIATKDGIITTHISDVCLADEPEEMSVPILKPKHNKRRLKPQKAKKEIDLHLDVLDPKRQISQHRMLDFQIEACRKFLNAALDARYRTVVIIHGKGSGILKQEIQHLLKMSDLVDYSFEINDGGATEVWLKISSLN